LQTCKQTGQSEETRFYTSASFYTPHSLFLYFTPSPQYEVWAHHTITLKCFSSLSHHQVSAFSTFTCIGLLVFLQSLHIGIANQLHGAGPFLRSRQLCCSSRTSQHFMEPEVSIPCSQEPSTCPYLCQINPVHTTSSYLPKITHWNTAIIYCQVY
jgi:hypothetical protein